MGDRDRAVSFRVGKVSRAAEEWPDRIGNDLADAHGLSSPSSPSMSGQLPGMFSMADRPLNMPLSSRPNMASSASIVSFLASGPEVRQQAARLRER